MGVRFFGQFLLERGVITSKQLFEAIALQGSKNSGFGAIALRLGFLTEQQALSIAAKQRMVDKRFGELAMADGWLTDAQVNRVLTYQKNSHVHIGEALVLTKALDREQIQLLLEAFNRDQEPYRVDRLVLPPGTKHPPCVEAAIDLTKKLLLRVAHVQARTGKGRFMAEPRLAADLIVSSSISGSLAVDLCLLASEPVARVIMRGMASERVVPESSLSELVDGIKEFLNLIAGNVCSKLAQLGLECRMAAPKQLHAGLERGSAPAETIFLCPLFYPEGALSEELIIAIVAR